MIFFQTVCSHIDSPPFGVCFRESLVLIDYTQKSTRSTLALKLSVAPPSYPWVTATPRKAQDFEWSTQCIPPLWVTFYISHYFTGLHTKKAYTHTGTSSNQCVHQICRHFSRQPRFFFVFYGSFLCYFQCLTSKLSVRIGWRKYLYECTPFWYGNLWFHHHHSSSFPTP